MLTLYGTAEKTGQRPSTIFGIDDPCTAIDFDNAVVLVGRVIDNVSQQMEKVGSGANAQWRPKHSMKELLDPDFRLPTPGAGMSGLAMLGMMASNPRSGVKQWRVKKSTPEASKESGNGNSA